MCRMKIQIIFQTVPSGPHYVFMIKFFFAFSNDFDKFVIITEMLNMFSTSDSGIMRKQLSIYHLNLYYI